MDGWIDLHPKPELPKEGQYCLVIVDFGRNDEQRVARFSNGKFYDADSNFITSFCDVVYWKAIK